MTTLNISEENFTDFKQEQVNMRKETGESWDNDRLLAFLIELKRKVKK